MPTVYHPTFRDVSLDVTDDQREDYVASGWRTSPISAAAALAPQTYEQFPEPAVVGEEKPRRKPAKKAAAKK